MAARLEPEILPSKALSATSQCCFSIIPFHSNETGFALKYSPSRIFEIATAVPVTKEQLSANKLDYMNRFNHFVLYAVTHQVSLVILNLESCTVCIVGYSDASFATSYDLSSQLAYIIMLVDAHDNSAQIMFKSYKSRRMIQLAMTREVIALTNMSDITTTMSTK